MEILTKLYQAVDLCKLMDKMQIEKYDNYVIDHIDRLVSFWAGCVKMHENQKFRGKLIKEKNSIDQLPDFGPEKWLTLVEISHKFPSLGHPNMLGDYIRENPEKAQYFYKKEGRKYLIKPKRCIYYLCKFGKSRIKNRVEPIANKLGII